MSVNWIERIFRHLAGGCASALYLSRDRAEWPAWLTRDVGLDNPENGKAVHSGQYRKAETAVSVRSVRPVRRT